MPCARVSASGAGRATMVCVCVSARTLVSRRGDEYHQSGMAPISGWTARLQEAKSKSSLPGPSTCISNSGAPLSLVDAAAEPPRSVGGGLRALRFGMRAEGMFWNRGKAGTRRPGDEHGGGAVRGDGAAAAVSRRFSAATALPQRETGAGRKKRSRDVPGCRCGRNGGQQQRASGSGVGATGEAVALGCWWDVFLLTLHHTAWGRPRRTRPSRRCMRCRAARFCVFCRSSTRATCVLSRRSTRGCIGSSWPTRVCQGRGFDDAPDVDTTPGSRLCWTHADARGAAPGSFVAQRLRRLAAAARGHGRRQRQPGRGRAGRAHQGDASRRKQRAHGDADRCAGRERRLGSAGCPWRRG